jgi:hypothetical protein
MAVRKSNGAGRPSAPLRFYDRAFVLNAASGMFYRLSPAADYLLRAMAAGAQPGQFAELIMSRYGADRATAVRDTELLLNQFTALGLLDSAQIKQGAGA